MLPVADHLMAQPTTRWIVEGGVLLFGAMVGSFLNVCIYRIPRDRSLVRPGSACPRCGAPISWFDNIPVFSFLLLMGRCRRCEARISSRYPFVEALTAALFFLAFRILGLTGPLIAAWTFTAMLIVVSFIDLDFQIIPNRITYPGILVGLFFSFLWPCLHPIGCCSSRWFSLGRGLAGGIVGYGLLALVGLVSCMIYKKEAMGRGDFKLLAMLGTVLGWQGVLWTVVLASLGGSVVGIALILIGKKSRRDFIPFGPFLASAGVFVLYFGNRLLELWRATFMDIGIGGGPL